MPSTVVGARGDVRDVEGFVEALKAEAAARGLQAQAFDADMVFGEDHLQSAWDHAERAMQRGTNAASDPMVELLLYAAGERQIGRAIEKMGVKEGRGRLVLQVVGDGDVEGLLQALGLRRDDEVVQGDVAMLPKFGISDAEVATVPAAQVLDLVLERVAMVDLMK